MAAFITPLADGWSVGNGRGACMQECWARLRVELHDYFKLDEHHMVYAGMALGIPDPNDPVNDLYAERAPLEEIVEFKGF